MELIEKIDKAIEYTRQGASGQALMLLLEIKSQLTPGFRIGDCVGVKDEYEEFGDVNKINDCLFRFRDDSMYYWAENWECLMPENELIKIENGATK